VPILLEHLTGDRETLSRAALSGLAAYGPGLRDVSGRERVYEAVHPRLRAAEPGVRINAILALGNLGDDRAVPDLEAFLADASRATRHGTVDSLAALGTPVAIQALVARLPQADERDRIALVMALGRTRDPAIVPPLLELFEAVRGGGTRLPGEIVNAIYRFGGRDVERLLKACAGDFFCPARERAAKRLRDLQARRTDPPWS
jgi:HEAT repeat protein